MGERAADFRDTLLELIDASPEAMDHPTPDQWLAYQRGELAEEEEARLQEHLVRCRDCFDLAEAAAAFAPPDEEPGSASNGEAEETAALWGLLRPQLEPPKDPPLPQVREIAAAPPRRRSWRSWGSRLALPLAASFLVALVGLTAWNLRLQGDLAELRRPKPGAPIVYFSPGERVAASGERTLAAAPGPLMLVFPTAERLPAYRLTLHDEATGEELGSYALTPDEDLALTLQLPEGLPPGRYRFDLADAAGGGAGPVAETFLLRVTEPVQGE